MYMYFPIFLPPEIGSLRQHTCTCSSRSNKKEHTTEIPTTALTTSSLVILVFLLVASSASPFTGLSSELVYVYM